MFHNTDDVLQLGSHGNRILDGFLEVQINTDNQA